MDNPIYGIDATNAGLFSQAAYDPIKTDESSLLPNWTEDVNASAINGSDQVRVFVNNSPGVDEIVMAFKGVYDLQGFKNAVNNNGAVDYSSFYQGILSAYTQAKNDNPGDTVIVDGHSLGGGLAQDFALQNNLNGFGQNSLPLTVGTPSSISAYQAAYKFIETNVAGDPATLLFSGLEHGLYLDSNPTTLPSIYPSVEVAGMTATAGEGDLGIGDAIIAFLRAHQIATVNELSSQYGLTSDGHLNVQAQSTDVPTNDAIWFVESYAKAENIVDNGNGSYSVADFWDDQFTVSVTGSDSGSGQSLIFSSTENQAHINPGETWVGTLTASMSNSDISNPIYSVSWNESNTSNDYDPDSETYTYNADGSFSGQYTGPTNNTYAIPSYNFSFDPSTGVLVGNGGDNNGPNRWSPDFTYLPDGSSSGSGFGESVTSQFSIASDGTATWDNTITEPGLTYTDNYVIPVAGGYEENYADNTGYSYEYAQNADGVETV